MDNNNQDHTHDDCPYCQDLAAKEAGTIAPHSHDDCPYCARLAHQAEDGHDTANCPYCQSYDERHAGHNADDCPYCQSMAERQPGVAAEAGPSVNLPTTQDSENFVGQNLDAPGIPKPDATSEPPIGLGTSMEAETTNNNDAINANLNQGVPNEIPSTQESVQLDHSTEALQAIAQEIESDGQATPTQSDAQVAESVDDAALAVGTNMEGNTSRPAGFDQNTPQDMGIAETPQSSDDQATAPDLTSVLHEGLDSHADNIQREKVVQMVSTALAGFKSSKEILERAQSQAPQLYQSSIQMLKAMIEMARMLGFGQDELPANDNNPLNVDQNEWSNPFPKHPDHGGQPMPGHAPSPAAAASPAGAIAGPAAPGAPQGQEGTIGQPLGKLPTSATTEHVARTPLLPGAVNTQGQKKVIDPDTGKTRWIDMKEGRVQGPTGIPVKPPAQGQNGSKA